MKATICFLLLLFVIISCCNASQRGKGNKKIHEVFLYDQEGYRHKLNDSTDIMNLINSLAQSKKTDRVPMRNTGMVEIQIVYIDESEEFWEFCNTPKYGVLLVKTNEYSNVFRNPNLDSFFISYAGVNSNFSYW